MEWSILKASNKTRHFRLKMGQLSCETDHAVHWMTEELKFDSQKG